MQIFALDKKFLHFCHEKWVDAWKKILHIATIFLYAFWMPLKNVYYIIYLDFSLFCAIHIWELANNLYEWMFFKCLLTSPFYPKSLLAYKLVSCKRWKGVIYDSRPALHFLNIFFFTWNCALKNFQKQILIHIDSKSSII